eukprot:6211291-Pleurochrysis_carterae.AAC.1
MLEPRDTTVLEQQYGSYLESDEAAGARCGAPPPRAAGLGRVFVHEPLTYVRRAWLRLRLFHFSPCNSVQD